VTKSDPRLDLVDAAERLLVRDGRAAVTTRRLAAEAGLNHGLVHYHFGSVEAVLGAVLDRALERVLGRLRAALAGGAPFLARWRAAMAALDAQVAGGDARLLAELSTAALHAPALRARIAAAAEEWRALLAAALADAVAEYGLSPATAPPAAGLLEALLAGMTAERVLEPDRDHEELVRWVEGWLLALAEAGRGAPPPV
jgi:AcrR family transcriptional regulator